MSPGEYLAWALFGLLFGWVGHACVWTASLNYLYGCPLPKWFLKPYRLFCGVVILAFPVLVWVEIEEPMDRVFGFYRLTCFAFGLFVFPVVTAGRLVRSKPAAVVAERTETVDYWKRLGPGGRRR
jgi:hypothetical protein